MLYFTRYIIELLEVVLTNNYFDFNGKHITKNLELQMVPSWHLHMPMCLTKFEQNHIYAYHAQATLQKRFIDDIFMIWPHGMDLLLEFIQHLNNVHPTVNSQARSLQQKYHFWTS